MTIVFVWAEDENGGGTESNLGESVPALSDQDLSSFIERYLGKESRELPVAGMTVDAAHTADGPQYSDEQLSNIIRQLVKRGFSGPALPAPEASDLQGKSSAQGTKEQPSSNGKGELNSDRSRVRPILMWT